jgi:UDP-N-acetylglucosamine 3-dehydrogenase
MLRRVKCGVIGLGWFGERHCEALADLPTAELYAVCTRTPARLEEVARRFSVRRSFTDYREMLADPELEAVSVVTMWDQHAGPTLAALEAGKHILLEKPMASTLADCERIVEAARRARGSFMVGHICRFNPRYASAKQEIDDGRVGRIVSIYARRNLSARITEGVLPKIGPIIGDAVHDTDLMLWFTGADVAVAYAQTVRVRDYAYPDIGWTMYRLTNGAVGVCENVWCMPGRVYPYLDERMLVVGTRGSISIHDTAANYAVVDGEGVSYPDTTYWPMLHGRRAGALRDEWAYFIGCVLEGVRPSIITPEESLRATRACLAAEESAATGRPIQLK